MGITEEDDILLHQNYECFECGASWKISHNEMETITYCAFCGSDNVEELVIEKEVLSKDFGPYEMDDDAEEE